MYLKESIASEFVLIQVAPARDAVLYERAFLRGDRIQEQSIYSGEPSPELDLAWHNLLDSERPLRKDVRLRFCFC